MGRSCGEDEGPYRSHAAFLFDTLVANRNMAIDEEDVAFFRDMREMLDDDYTLGCRRYELSLRNEGVTEPELTDEEREELACLREKPHIAWSIALMRAERCVANWCIANPELVDRQGKPVVEGAIAKIDDIFEPSPPPAEPCSISKGKKWLAPANPSDFPTACLCTTQSASREQR